MDLTIGQVMNDGTKPSGFLGFTVYIMLDKLRQTQKCERGTRLWYWRQWPFSLMYIDVRANVCYFASLGNVDSTNHFKS